MSLLNLYTAAATASMPFVGAERSGMNASPFWSRRGVRNRWPSNPFGGTFTPFAAAVGSTGIDSG